MQPKPHFDGHDPKECKLLTRLWFGLSLPYKNKFNQSFQNCPYPICIFRREIETASHYLLGVIQKWRHQRKGRGRVNKNDAEKFLH